MKKNKLPPIIALLIFSFITIILGVAFNIYRAFSQKPTPVVPENVIMDLDPNLDINTINTIKERSHPQ